MTTSNPFVKANNGHVYITDQNLDHDALFDALAEWNYAQSAADEDFDARRLNAYEKSSKVAESKADDVRDEASLRLTWQGALALADQLATAAARARQQELAAERAAHMNPLLRKA